MRGLLFTLILLTCAAATATTIYKWVDENGVTHFSDQPHPGAQKLEIGSAQTYSPSEPAVTARPRTAPAAIPDAGRAYQSCAITRPANDEVLFNISAMTGAVHLRPRLAPGHTISIVFDGKPLDVPVADSEFTISPIFRGTHTLAALVRDADGRALCQSPTVTFHVRQPSVKAPNPANRPRF